MYNDEDMNTLRSGLKTLIFTLFLSISCLFSAVWENPKRLTKSSSALDEFHVIETDKKFYIVYMLKNGSSMKINIGYIDKKSIQKKLVSKTIYTGPYIHPQLKSQLSYLENHLESILRHS